MISAMLDPNIMNKTGRILVTAELGQEYGFKDVGGWSLLFIMFFTFCNKCILNCMQKANLSWTFPNGSHQSMYLARWHASVYGCYRCAGNNCLFLKRLGWFSNRTGTSVDDGARKSNNWLDQWQSDKLGTGSRVESFPRAFPSSNDVRGLLLNQSISTGTVVLSSAMLRT